MTVLSGCGPNWNDLIAISSSERPILYIYECPGDTVTNIAVYEVLNESDSKLAWEIKPRGIDEEGGRILEIPLFETSEGWDVQTSMTESYQRGSEYSINVDTAEDKNPGLRLSDDVLNALSSDKVVPGRFGKDPIEPVSMNDYRENAKEKCS